MKNKAKEMGKEWKREKEKDPNKMSNEKKIEWENQE